ncbi:MAG TPA: hypothetical protein VK563_03555 [Puia sp.]|nr:hypothetical protein [Puia sp.]
MKYPRYLVTASDDYCTYLFFSEGLRGRIAKGVIYSRIEGNLFNLGFGDWNEEFQELDDSNRSNNGDRDKVLATVAFTAFDFTNKYPDAWIVAEGSTPTRTRLYQMGMADNLLEINENFEIDGLLNGLWEPFQRGMNYEAFLIRRKKIRKFETI